MCQTSANGEGYGTQNYICSQCLNHFCSGCGDGVEGHYLEWCSACEKDSHVNIVMRVGSISAINVKKQNGVMIVKINYAKVALKRRHAAVAALQDAGVVFYLTFVKIVNATKLYALCVFRMRIAGAAIAMVAYRNFVPLNVDSTYRSAVKKMGKVFVAIVHLRVRVCLDDIYKGCQGKSGRCFISVGKGFKG